MKYKLIQTTITLADSSKRITLESRGPITKKHREVLDDFFRCWNIASVESSDISNEAFDAYKLSEKPQTATVPVNPEHNFVYSPKKRIKMLRKHTDSEFTIDDYVHVFMNIGFSSKENIKHFKTAFRYDIKLLLRDKKVELINKNTHPYIYRWVSSNIPDISEDKEMSKRLLEDRNTLIKTFK